MHIQTSVRLALALGGLTLAGACTTVYTPPPAGVPTAELTVVNASAGPSAFELYAGAERCTDRFVTKPMLAAGLSRTVTVKALGPLSFTNIGVIGNTACYAAVTFTPEPGRRYRFTYHGDRGGCSGALADEASGQAVEFTPRLWTTPWDERGPFCAEGALKK